MSNTQPDREFLHRHLQTLEQQAQQLRDTQPDFDLHRELRDPVFARMTAPGSGVPLEAAYYAVHHAQLKDQQQQEVARQVANAIRSGYGRPQESGMTARAPAVTVFDYKNATRQQRAAFKKQIHDAAAKGEKLYPAGGK